jgi:hypothetical protein
MKKFSIIFVVAVFALTACKKENVSNVKNTQQTDSKKIEALILNFKDKLDNNLKDGTTYMADSAVWYVEALLNYSYGYATALGCTFETDSVATTVNTNGANGYTLVQLNDVYEYLEEEALENKPDDHYIFCIDVSLTVNDNQTSFSGVSGYAKQFLPSYKSTADTSGYWYWGDALGMCSSDSGLYVGTDAADIIEDLVNSTAEYDYFTNIQSSWYYYGSYTDANFPFSDQFLLHTRLFAYCDTTGSNEDFCLSPSHISYYSGNNGALYIVKGNKPSNREFAYCTVSPWTITTPETDNHSIYISYGSPIERD